ncbi:MAG: long-chain fatty acid--CoA ligase [Alphaproteobacteria bacterium]
MSQPAARQENQKDFPWVRNYAPNVTWDITVPQQPLFTFLDKTAEKFPARPAIHFAGQVYDFRTVHNLADRAAKGLQALGVRKGVKVGLFMPNCAYSVVMYYAILKAGATVVNYNPVYVDRDLIVQADDSETDVIVTIDVPPLLEKIKVLLDKTRIRKAVVCPVKQNLTATTKTLDLPAVSKPDAWLWFCDLISNSGKPEAVTINPDEDIAVLQYTGGTTGIPKGAMLTHKNLVANTIQIGQWYYNANDGEDSMIAVLPLFHVFAMTVVMNMSVMKGMELFIMPQFTVPELLELIKSQKPAYVAAVPTMYIAMANYDRIGEYDFSSIKFCLSGGAPLPADVKRIYEQRTKAKLVAEGYGLTECSPVVTCNPISVKARAGSIGLPIPGTIVEIISLEDGKTPLPVGERGEICCTGPQVMKGYYKNPQATAEVTRDGRLHTGDVGYIDEDGFVYIVDRVKDLILVGGYNVYPRHVEEVIYAHPAIEECIVAGVPDKLRGEAVHAWVKLRPGESVSVDTLRAWLHDKLSPIELPKKIHIRNEPLPKTAVGKLSKRDLLVQEGIHKR